MPEDASEGRGVSSFGFAEGTFRGNASEKSRVTTFRLRRPGTLTERQKRCVGTCHEFNAVLQKPGSGGISVRVGGCAVDAQLVEPYAVVSFFRQRGVGLRVIGR